MDSRASYFYFAFHKAATTAGYLGLLLLTWRLIDGKAMWQVSAGSTFLSAAWLILTRLKMYHLLQTYFDVFSRLEIVVPMGLGVVLSVVALMTPSGRELHATAVLEIIIWGLLFGIFWRNKSRYEKRGYGPVPKGTWISPPASVFKPGDLILTSGNVARRLRESVGHAAAVVQDPGGALFAISSHMDRGCTLEPIEDVLQETRHGYYIVLELAHQIPDSELPKMYELAMEMVKENRDWSSARNVTWHKFVVALPVPQSWKDFLLKVYRCTGYDWLGMLFGRLPPHRWTCIGAALELYHRMGIKTNPYGTGLLGFGTSLLDPIMPVRFLADPAFRLLTKDDIPASLAPFVFE